MRTNSAFSYSMNVAMSGKTECVGCTKIRLRIRKSSSSYVPKSKHRLPEVVKALITHFGDRLQSTTHERGVTHEGYCSASVGMMKLERAKGVLLRSAQGCTQAVVLVH